MTTAGPLNQTAPTIEIKRNGSRAVSDLSKIQKHSLFPAQNLSSFEQEKHRSPAPASTDIVDSGFARNHATLENPANPNLLPNKLPQPPIVQENGNLIAGSSASLTSIS